MYTAEKDVITSKFSMHLHYLPVKSISQLTNPKTKAHFITFNWTQITDDMNKVYIKSVRNDKTSPGVCMKDYVDVFSLVDILTAYFSAEDTYSTSDFQLSPEKSFPAQITLASLLSFGHIAS